MLINTVYNIPIHILIFLVCKVCFSFCPLEGQLFYTGPNRQYMRLVVQSDAHKEAVLQECHSDPCTGKHNGIRSTRNTVVSTYYWSTITEDVNDWVRQVSVEFTHHYMLHSSL